MGSKFLLLLKKNVTMKLRCFTETLIELLIVIGSLLLYGYLALHVKVEEYEGIHHDEYPLLESLQASSFYLLYAPNSSKVSLVMSCFESLYKLKGFSNEKHLLNFYKVNENSTFAALQFDSHNFTEKNISIRLRFPSELRKVNKQGGKDISNWMTRSTYPQLLRQGPRDFNNCYGAYPSKSILFSFIILLLFWQTCIIDYYLEGFLTLQYLTSFFFINRDKIKTSCNISNMLDVDIRMKRFPHGKWIINLYGDLFMALFPVFSFSFLFIFWNLIKNIVLEKEKQLKESMKIMGLPLGVYWCSWFWFYFIYFAIYNLFITIAFKCCKVLPLTNPIILFVFLTLFSSLIINFGLFLSTFFSKASTAAQVSFIIFVLTIYPGTIIQYYEKKYEKVWLWAKLLSCVAPISAVNFGYVLMVMFETNGEGIQWSNISEPISENDPFNFVVILLMLTVDNFIYLFFALCIDALVPSEYGVPLPWFFLCSPQYWCGASRTATVSPQLAENQEILVNEFFEKEPIDLKVGIKVVNLHKVFKNTVAVNHLSLNIFENQITVLLGQNGAGKTTTILLLTGMLKPTSGTAIIDGFDINTNKNDARKSMSICLQNTVVFETLTVAEHIHFYCKLKGVDNKDIQKEVDKYVNLLDLSAKKDKKSSQLSGGMNRKLSIGIALCGNSKILFLDEPTSGMDPASRRSLWKVLEAEKSGRTILLTTHYMDEAEFLGDRIAIMAHGELQCCGTSFFLKKKYSSGYHLIIDKSNKCNPNDVTLLLRKYITNTVVRSGAYSNIQLYNI